MSKSNNKSSNSSAWAPLLPAAMVGTQRHALPDGAAWPGAIGALIQQAQQAAADPALGALRSAAVLAACGLAGARAHEPAQGLPAAAPAERLPAPPPGPLNEGLVWVLQEGPAQLQHEALLRLADLGLRLPHGLLPQALEAGRRSLALRAPLVPVLGARGLWLAAQHADWAWAAGVAGADADDPSQWSEGSLAQRCAWLQRLRQRDPAAARAELEQVLPALPAKERVDLLGALATGLGPQDEALLERLCADRSREVRQLAQAMLRGLPDSARAHRAQACVARLLTKQRRMLGADRWLVDAPTQADPAWAGDLAERPRHDTLGERGWWLCQLVGQIPLRWWTEQLGMDPPALLAWAAGTDWQEALLRGWHEALLAAPEAAWCDALLARWPQELLHVSDHLLMRALPAELRERHWLRRLGAQGSAALIPAMQDLRANSAPGRVLSPALSQALATQLAHSITAGALTHDASLRFHLSELLCLLHPRSLDLLPPWPRSADEAGGLSDLLASWERLLQLRRALFHSSSSATPTSP